ncbi:MAG TPA: MarR family transcriptional regulator [Trueperaceae bacterium]
MSELPTSSSQAHYEELSRLLTRIKKLQQPYGRVEDLAGVRPAEIYLLVSIGRLHTDGKDATISSIAETVGVSSAAITNTVTALERLDYVRRERCSEDRRVVLVSLTEKGQGVLESLRKDRERMFVELLDYLGESDTRELIRLATRFMDFLEARNRVSRSADDARE